MREVFSCMAHPFTITVEAGVATTQGGIVGGCEWCRRALDDALAMAEIQQRGTA
jgi:hypothetical protein